MEVDIKALEIENSSPLSFDGPLIPLISPTKISTTTTSKNNLTINNPRFNSLFNQDWLCETFIIPASFTRSVLGCSKQSTTTSNSDSSSSSPTSQKIKIDLSKSLIELYSNQVNALKKVKDPNHGSKELENEAPLFLAVNRYSRINKTISIQSGLTLVFAHANGFHKEIWEPTLAELLKTENNNSTIPIAEIFALDCVNQGDSAVLNEQTLGNTFSWVDNGRDILNFLISYIDSNDLQQTATSSPKHLSPNLSQSHLLSLDHSNLNPGSSNPIDRKTKTGRTIVGLGHSLGGAGISFAATAIPSLFSSLIFLDPVLPPTDITEKVKTKNTQKMTAGALIRRDFWPNGREEALEGFLKKPFFQSWDSRVLNRYVEFGLKDLPSGGVGLKCPKDQEALVFADPRAAGSKRAATRLSNLTSNLPVHFIFADVNKSVLDEPSIELLCRQTKHATSVRLPGAAHLIAQEKPKETALEIRKFLNKVYSISKKVGKL